MDLRRQIAIIRAWLPLIFASAALAAIAAFGISNVLPKTYEAKATLIVGQSLTSANPDYNQLLVSQRLSTTYASIATKRPVLGDVIRLLDLDVTPDQLSRRVRADASLDSTLLTITAESADGGQAAAIANALAEQLIAASPAIQGRETEFQAFVDAELSATQTQIETAQARLEVLSALGDRTAAQEAELQTLQGRLATLRSTYATLLPYASGSSASLLSVIEPALAGTDPVSPRPLLNTALAGLLGLLVAVGIAFLVEFLDDSIKDADAVQEVTNLSTLGTISRMNGHLGRNEIYRLAPLLYPRSGAAEAYRTLRTNVEFTSVDAPIRTLLVTSAMPDEGKTITASNLALVFAQGGHRVLLVDADLRKPGVHLAFRLDNERGLTTLVREDGLDLDAVAQATEEQNLRVVTTGPLPPNPAELMGSHRMRGVVDRMKASVDLVVFDSPPLQAVSDAALLSSYLDGTLLVIDATRSRRRVVHLGVDALAKAGANVLGVVLNRIPSRLRTDYEAYGGYYGYGEAQGPGRQPEVSGGHSPG